MIALVTRSGAISSSRTGWWMSQVWVAMIARVKSSVAARIPQVRLR